MHYKLGEINGNYLSINSCYDGIEFYIKHGNINRTFRFWFKQKIDLKNSKPSKLVSNLIKLLATKEIERVRNCDKNMELKLDIKDIIIFLDKMLKHKLIKHFDSEYFDLKLKELKYDLDRYQHLNDNMKVIHDQKLKFHKDAIKRLENKFEKNSIYFPKKIANLKKSIDKLQKEAKNV